MYCMLTGQPPHRNEDAVSEIDSLPDLEPRLERYRDYILNAQQLTDHRRVSGVDRELGDIVDRCLAADPDRRFANVQSVLDALQSRDSVRDRRPLLILGLLGPLLFLLLAAFAGWGGYRQAISDSEKLLHARAVKENQFAAEFVAEAVARRIEGYFRSVERVADDPEIIRLMQQIKTENKQLEELGSPGIAKEFERYETLVREFKSDESRKRIQSRVETELANSRSEIASWFITNHKGTHVASAFNEVIDSSPIGKTFAWRSYFTGLPNDLPRDQLPKDDQHVKDTRLSAVFLSTATNQWKVAVSTPIWDKSEENKFVGIVALTVELGRLGQLLHETQDDDQFLVLIRKSGNLGQILQHPLFAKIRDTDTKFPAEFGEQSDKSQAYFVRLDEAFESRVYQDPLAKHPTGKDYDHNWIAAIRDVKLNPTNRHSNDQDEEELDTKLAVIVQENYDFAGEPIFQLGRDLMRLGLATVAGLIAVVLVLWYFVARALRDPNERIRRRGGTRQPLSSLHSMETVELPSRMKRRFNNPTER